VRVILDAAGPKKQQLVVDVHPDRPDFRGVRSSPSAATISLDEDPRFEDIERAGAHLRREDEVHAVLDGMFLVSGQIPRVTAYEKGIRGGMRFRKTTGAWEEDEAIADERFVMCNLKGEFDIPAACTVLRPTNSNTIHRQGPRSLHGMQSRRPHQCMQARS
jgi:7,8-dihydropterin-6-yl-methyl-4-(beta-D-ribofuranosyl)aminobenzene 5'-phosphate synthase